MFSFLKMYKYCICSFFTHFLKFQRDWQNFGFELHHNVFGGQFRPNPMGKLERSPDAPTRYMREEWERTKVGKLYLYPVLIQLQHFDPIPYKIILTLELPTCIFCLLLFCVPLPGVHWIQLLQVFQAQEYQFFACKTGS